VQLIALIYGSASLWNGRPLYYGFSENVPLVVQAYDIESSDANEARRVNPELAPHWYSLPRWVWAPLPNEQKNGKETIDAMSMPKYFKPWDQGFPTLRSRLQKLSDWKFFSVAEKKSLEKRMQGAGLSIDQQNTIPLTGRGRPALIVFEPTTLKIVAILRSN
jgi:hypothetical protein